MTPLAVAGAVIAGRYRLESIVGKGGMGAVWAATHLGLHRVVAVKIISSDFARSHELRRRFDTEAKAAAKLQSRHVVQIYNNGELADGTPFISTTTPSPDELIGYTIFRSTESCILDFVHVTSLPFITTNLVNPTGGLGYYYHIQAYNPLGVSTNVLTISALGERRFFLDQCDTVMVMDAASGATLNAATNGRGADVRIMKTRRPQDVGGSIFQSAEWRAFLNGVTEIAGFTLPKPARIVMHFDTLAGVVVPSTAPLSGLSVAGNGAAPAAVAPKNVGMYWNNGSDFKKMYGAVDVNAQTVTVDSPNLGIYQVRSLFRSAGAVFDLSNISGRVITPNGDGLNDFVIFTYDPGPSNAAVRGRIYDVTGSFVAEMAPGIVPNTLQWDGKMNGRAATSGVYIYKIEGDGKTYTGTVVVAR